MSTPSSAAGFTRQNVLEVVLGVATEVRSN